MTTNRLQLAITADLHWGHRKGAEATQSLVAFLRDEKLPDVLILAGDIGTERHFEGCLELFSSLDCRKVLVPGNHDIWVNAESPCDSLDLYERQLPEGAARHGFHYLDQGPLVLPQHDVALVGTINWYDYSWALEGIRQYYPADEHRLQSKRFTRGKHNDANFVRWPIDDVGFTSLITATLERHLLAALEQVSRVILIAHHPPFYGLSFPRPGPPVLLDSFLWDAFAGNVGVEQILARHAERIAFAFCGHTHCERQTTWEGIQGFNVGGDYHFKRLLWLDWPEGHVERISSGCSIKEEEIKRQGAKNAKEAAKKTREREEIRATSVTEWVCTTAP